MLLAAGDPVGLGTADAPRLAFTTEGTRQLTLDGRAAFDLSFWCGTCPFLFERLDGPRITLSLRRLAERLTDGLDDPEPAVVERFGALLPQADYRPLLLKVAPRLQLPAAPGDYFSEDQVQVWGIDPATGVPENPRTPYYRTVDHPLGPDHRGIERRLYEFVVPMVPPTMNDPDQVAAHAARLLEDDRPTAVALTTLDVCLPATTQTDVYVEHWCLTHFLLDGHHKVAAAAAARRPLRLLALLSVPNSLATADEVAQLPSMRAQCAL